MRTNFTLWFGDDNYLSTRTRYVILITTRYNKRDYRLFKKYCLLVEHYREGEERGMYRVLVGKPEGKRPLGRPRRKWVDNIMKDLKEMGCGYVDWTGLAQVRDWWRTLVSAVMNLRVP